MEAKACKKVLIPQKSRTEMSKQKSKVTTPVTLPHGHQDSPHIPDLHSIRQTAILQPQVAKRLKELTDSEKPGTKLKSLRGGGGSCGSHGSQPY